MVTSSMMPPPTPSHPDQSYARPRAGTAMSLEIALTSSSSSEDSSSPEDVRRHRSGTSPTPGTTGSGPTIPVTPSCLDAHRCVRHCEGYGRACPESARKAAEYALRSVRVLLEDSPLFEPLVQQRPATDSEAQDAGALYVDFPRYVDPDDIQMGDLLGTGGFCTVHACTIRPRATAIGASSPPPLLARKTLRRQCLCDANQFRHGAADLVLEAHFLRALSHPHIVTLHAVPTGPLDTAIQSFAVSPTGHGPESPPSTAGYFILMDRLVETLDTRIQTWHSEQAAYTNKHSWLSATVAPWRLMLSDSRRTHEREQLWERLRVAYAVADAMAYLHRQRIVYRDLKPDNVGFTNEGVVKLFDFGLAKELRKDRADAYGMYVLSGNTGSRRYMASEVAKGLPYGLAVDVYSFGIMLWEMCSAEKPFCEYTCAKHMQHVVLGGERPPMDHRHVHSWPLELQWLMKRCWSGEPTLRPTFAVVLETLRGILVNKKDNGSASDVLEKCSRDVSMKDAQDQPTIESALAEPQPTAPATTNVLPSCIEPLPRLEASRERTRSWGGFVSLRHKKEPSALG